MNDSLQLMIIDDEPIVGQRLKRILEKDGYHVDVYTESREAVRDLGKGNVGIIITDYKMDGYDGLDILEMAKIKCPDAKVIIITGYIDQSIASSALRMGAFDFIIKPFTIEQIKDAIQRAEHELNNNNIH